MDRLGTILSREARGKLWVRMGIRCLCTALVVLLCYLFGSTALTLFAPFIAAFVVAWLLNPLVQLLQKKMGLGRGILSLLLLLTALFAAGGLLTAIISNFWGELQSLRENWQGIWQDIKDNFTTLRDYLIHLLHMEDSSLVMGSDQWLDDSLSWIQTTLPTYVGDWASSLGAMAMKIPTVVVAVIVFIMASYFLTADYPRLQLTFTGQLSPNMSRFGRHLKETILTAFGGYLRAQLLLSLGVLLILLVGFTLLDEPYGVTMAVVFSMLDFIPLIGAGTIMVPWAIIDVLMGNYQHAVMLMIIWGVICLFRRVAEPKAVGSQTGLSPILSLISIYVGMRLGGVLGMILGPVFCLVVINLTKSGTFDGLIADIRLIAGDVTALLEEARQPRDRQS